MKFKRVNFVEAIVNLLHANIQERMLWVLAAMAAMAAAVHCNSMHSLQFIMHAPPGQCMDLMH